MRQKRVEKHFEIKGMDDKGSFTGLLSPYDLVDQGKDIVCKGAFAKTIAEQKGTIPMLWQHDETIVIGKLNLEDKSDGLYVHGKLELELPKAQEAYILLKKGLVNGLSIGFQTLRDAVEGGARMIKEARLFEGSIVTFPMANTARITEVKGMSNGDFDEEFSEASIASAGYRALNVLQNCLGEAWYRAGIDPDSYYGNQGEDAAVLTTYSENVIDQFKAVWMSSITAYKGLLGDGDEDENKALAMELHAGWIRSAERKSAKSKRKFTPDRDKLLEAAESMKAMALLLEGLASTAEEPKAPLTVETVPVPEVKNVTPEAIHLTEAVSSLSSITEMLQQFKG